MTLTRRIATLERSRRTPVADTGDLFDTALMLSDPEACDLACEQIEVACSGGDFEEVGERLKARMNYLRSRDDHDDA